DPDTGKVWVLLGAEVRRKKLVLSHLAGKREDSDQGPEDTAWREFWEESGKILGEEERREYSTACAQGLARVLWLQEAQQVLLACEFNTQGMLALPKRFGSGMPG
ncbi:unnamed protein product, partial [Discosporangium mesarthrocarpum]